MELLILLFIIGFILTIAPMIFTIILGLFFGTIALIATGISWVIDQLGKE